MAVLQNQQKNSESDSTEEKNIVQYDTGNIIKSDNNIEIAKVNLRSTIINRRRGLSSESRKKYNCIIKERLFSMFCFSFDNNIYASGSNGRNFLLYYSFNCEVDTLEIADFLLSSNMKVYFPLITGKGKMDFYRIDAMEDFHKGSFGIYEPAPKAENLFYPTGDDICIVPLVAFDRSLNRLGYGGGYYDRFFESYNIPYRIGLAYNLQQVDDIPVTATDIKLTNIITEEGIYE